MDENMYFAVTNTDVVNATSILISSKEEKGWGCMKEDPTFQVYERRS